MLHTLTFMRRFFSVCLFLLMMLEHYSQERIIHGVGRYCFNDLDANTTIAVGKNLAIELAKIDALRKNFGSEIMTTMSMGSTESNNDYEEFFSKFINEEVTGDFIEEPQVDCQKTLSDNLFCFECRVAGKARKNNTSTLFDNTVISISKDPEEGGSVQNIFDEGENIYVHLQAAFDAYLSIFMKKDDTVYRLLPYQNMKSAPFVNSVKLERDKVYHLFQAKEDKNVFEDFPYYWTDEILATLSANKMSSQQIFFFVLGKKPFDKPLLQQHPDLRIQYLPYSNFMKWLQKTREENVVDYKKISVLVRKRKS